MQTSISALSILVRFRDLSIRNFFEGGRKKETTHLPSLSLATGEAVSVGHPRILLQSKKL